MNAPKNKIRLRTLGKAELTKLILSLVFISAVFVPLIRMFAYMDAESIRKVVLSEGFATAVSNSLVSALLGTAVTVVLAKMVGCMLPMAAKAVHLDPAVMASPFISTIVDALSLLVYFMFAKMLLHI